MSEPSHRRRPGRVAARRASPAALGLVRVDPVFEQEYPEGDAASTEAYASLCRTGQALLQELDRTILAAADMPQAALTALAVIDGAGEALTPSQISERVLVASATMTSTLDLLEYRGWIVRIPNPLDRRSLLIEITDKGRATADRLLPGIRKVELKVLAGLNKTERKQLLNLLGKVLARAADVDSEPPEPLEGRRNRPARLTRPR